MDTKPSSEGTQDLPWAVHHGPVSYALFRISRLHRILAGQLLREVGLHPSQELVMQQLWEHGCMRQVDICELVGSDAPTMTRTVQRLERTGLVRRVPSPTDRRSVMVEPTAVGRAVRTQVEGIRAELERRLSEGLTEAAQGEAVAVLERLERNLAHHAENAACLDCGEEPYE
ncbi:MULTISPECIES: MarR family winged helix-turn-helix transcriptional regulator [Streptomyces]|uniref:MarR family winged helix-turn-helix transcriptional regulator n=1 Tax=Streptomyces lycopersici TaxID=2974589 RepID=UPI0021CEFFD5|nr:MarR family transcriptional regulator [Streptomyces sp. NEAU-383]